MNIMRNSRWATLLLTSLTGTAASQSLSYSASDITDLILITGQSNVTGSQTESDPAIDTVSARVFAYTSTNDWQIADLRQAWDVDGWHPGNGSLNVECVNDPNCTPRQPYNNFAFHFAKAVVENDPDRIVGIIVASAPGKGISHWDYGSPFWQTVENKALTALNAQGVKSQFDGILWHQGESDWQSNGTSDPDATPAERSHPTYYPEKLTALIQRLRSENWFGAQKPFICGETRQAPVNVRLMSLNSDDDPWTACVGASDLPTREMDLLATPPILGTHFNGAALRELGTRYGLRYLDMTSDPMVNDNIAPTATVTNPATNSTTVTASPILTGTATDTGGSGVNRVAVFLYDKTIQSYIDATGNPIAWGAHDAVLQPSNLGTANWSIETTLTDGNYWIGVFAYDAAGNHDANKRIFVNFSIGSQDSIAPTAIVTNPDSSNANVETSPQITGTITDIGGSGVERIAVFLYNRTLKSYINPTGNVTAWGSHDAVLQPITPDTATWTLNTTLPAGTYWVGVFPYDGVGNHETDKRIFIPFTVAMTDSNAPSATLTNPISNQAELSTSPTLTGTISDTGGSGVDRVAIFLYNTTLQSYVDPTGNTTAWGSHEAVVTADSLNSANWSLPTSLPAGHYWVGVFPYDHAENHDVSERIFVYFSISN